MTRVLRASPGQGYRTIKAGMRVRFELVERPTGPTARNVRRVNEGAYEQGERHP